MSSGPSDARPRQVRVADEMRMKIESGEYPPGSQLPTLDELAATHRVSLAVTRKAMDLLRQAGLVVTFQGKGTFVREYALLCWWPGTFEHLGKRRDTAEAGADAWAADVIHQGREPRQEVDVSIVEAPPEVADRLKVEPGDMVVVRRRLRLVDDVPFQTADSYYPRDVAEGTQIMMPGDTTVPGGLMAAVGHPQVRFVDEITIRMPTHIEAFRLELPAGTPVAEHVRTGYNREGRPVRVIITIVPGDRHKIVYEVGAE
jgi:GntR family transcriptional regulator